MGYIGGDITSVKTYLEILNTTVKTITFGMACHPGGFHSAPTFESLHPPMEGFETCMTEG